jgi:hypothetical protein
MQDVPFRKWGDNSTAASRDDKVEGVTDALELSSYDAGFRRRLLSQVASERKTALQEGGKFISLPPDLEVRSFEAKDPDRDNHVDLVLPEFTGLPPKRPNASMHWLCTWFPYDPMTPPPPKTKKPAQKSSRAKS